MEHPHETLAAGNRDGVRGQGNAGRVVHLEVHQLLNAALLHNNLHEITVIGDGVNDAIRSNGNVHERRGQHFVLPLLRDTSAATFKDILGLGKEDESSRGASVERETKCLMHLLRLLDRLSILSKLPEFEMLLSDGHESGALRSEVDGEDLADQLRARQGFLLAPVPDFEHLIAFKTSRNDPFAVGAKSDTTNLKYGEWALTPREHLKR